MNLCMQIVMTLPCLRKEAFAYQLYLALTARHLNLLRASKRDESTKAVFP